MNRLSMDKLKPLIDEHRRRWPVDRICAHPDVYRAECESVLSHLENGGPTLSHAPWPDDYWMRLLFDIPAEDASDGADWNPERPNEVKI